MALDLSTLQPSPGSTKPRKRVGRGHGCHGKTSCRGSKGQNARSGGGKGPGFEGGQTPWYRRLPKYKGFKSLNKIEYALVNLGQLESFESGTTVTLELLLQNALVRKPTSRVKIVGGGELTKSLTIQVHKFTGTAAAAIEAAGGKAEVNVGMLQTFTQSLQVKDLRQRLLNVAFYFALFVLAVHIPVPGINAAAWEALLKDKAGALGDFLGMFTGGALNKFSIAAMGITPYINASIIMQLLTVVIPKLHDLQKEGGEQGRRELAQYVRYLTMVLAVLQGFMMTMFLSRAGAVKGQLIFSYANSGPQFLLMVAVALVAGTAFLMWVGEQLTDKGIGNGVSLLIFAGIVLRYPAYLWDNLQKLYGTPAYAVSLFLFFLMFVLLIIAIIVISEGERKVPVHYAKRQVGRKVYGGQQTYIPIKVNNAGVISIIFAISIMYLPTTFVSWFRDQPGTWQHAVKNAVHTWFAPDSALYNLSYFLLVIFFTYFYSAISFNITDVADNMKKYGGFIPGIRPGRPTAEYLERILSRVTFLSAIFLGLIAVIPTYVMMWTKVTFYLGSTSILIIVGVALDTMKQIQARLMMRHYQGFMK